MPKATIKSSTGAVITIQGTEEEIAKIISDYENANDIAEIKPSTTRTTKNQKEKKRVGAGDLLTEMRERGFFDKPKTLAEMSSALEEQGFLYPTTTLSGVVLGLVKRKTLRRKKLDGRWVYGK
jgi:hypothetical protein